MLWFWAALAAAILWGVSYALSDYTLKQGISGTAQLAICGLFLTPFYGVVAWQSGSLQRSVELLRGDKKLLIFFIGVAVCYASANILTFWSIRAKNATLSSMIEIAYPFFTALFVWLIFGENQLTTNSVIGGLLIFSGIAFIYFGK